MKGDEYIRRTADGRFECVKTIFEKKIHATRAEQGRATMNDVNSDEIETRHCPDCAKQTPHFLALKTGAYVCECGSYRPRREITAAAAVAYRERVPAAAY